MYRGAAALGQLVVLDVPMCRHMGHVSARFGAILERFEFCVGSANDTYRSLVEPGGKVWYTFPPWLSSLSSYGMVWYGGMV